MRKRPTRAPVGAASAPRPPQLAVSPTTRTFALFVMTALFSAARAESLIDTIKAGDTAAALSLLADQRAAATETDSDGTTALHWAVNGNDVDLARALLEGGAGAGAVNRYGVPPLHLAAENGSAALVELLLAHGADVDSALPAGETALMTAARNGDVATLDVLIRGGADVSARESWKGQTALMWAAHENNADAIRTLLDAGAELDARSDGGEMNAFLFAVRAGAIDAARTLLERGADVNQTLADGSSALVLAVTNAHYELASVLLDAGADPNADAQGWTALHQIAWSRRWNMGFNLPGPYQTGGLDSLDLVEKLVAAGANVNARQHKEPIDGNRNKLNRIGATPFLLAAKACDVPLMRALLDLGADASVTTEEGTTALMAAAGVGIWAPGENPGSHEEALAAVKLALAAGGGDVDDVNANGETAVHGAVYRGGAVDVIQFLADQGARLDVVNKNGWSPVIVADGVEYTPAVLKRYPDAAALLRKLLAERGLPVPPSTQPGR